MSSTSPGPVSYLVTRSPTLLVVLVVIVIVLVVDTSTRGAEQQALAASPVRTVLLLLGVVGDVLNKPANQAVMRLVMAAHSDRRVAVRSITLFGWNASLGFSQ